MILCETCPRAFCKACIRLTHKQEQLQFACPACHCFGEKNVRPYVVSTFSNGDLFMHDRIHVKYRIRTVI
jgi:hypothetical protein